jgi:hypothetical protein
MRQTHVLLLAVALLACACAAPSRIVSNKAADYQKEPKRLFVVTDIGTDWGNDFFNAFRTRLATIVRECGATMEVSRITSLELDENIHLRRATAFKADSILSVRRNGGTKDQYGGLIEVIYDSRLVDMQTTKVAWRSNTRFARAPLFPLAERGQTLAVELTNKMKIDGIFHSCPVIEINKS